MPRPSGTRTSPRAAQTSGAARGSVSPRKRTMPEFAIRPMIARMSVDLPAPFGPRMAMNSPSAAARLAE